MTSRKIVTRHNIEMTEKEARALNLRRAGANYEQIGETLQMSAEGARKACVRALNKIPMKDADELRKLYNHRYDEWLLRLVPKINEGNLQALDRALRIQSEQRKMNNIDIAPVAADRDPLVQFQQVIALDPSIAAKLGAPHQIAMRRRYDADDEISAVNETAIDQDTDAASDDDESLDDDIADAVEVLDDDALDPSDPSAAASAMGAVVDALNESTL